MMKRTLERFKLRLVAIAYESSLKWTRETCQPRLIELAGNRILKSGYVLAVIVLSGGLVGCSMDATISSLNQSITEVFSKQKMAEVTPASSQNSFTTRGYIVQASVSYQDAAAEATTVRGNKVQTSIQGTLFKEQQ